MIIHLRGEDPIDVPYHHVFVRGCYGVALVPRGPDDNHICFMIIVEDDDNWFECNGAGSSSWLCDLEDTLHQAVMWCETYAFPDKVRGVQYGYRFTRKSKRK